MEDTADRLKSGKGAPSIDDLCESLHIVQDATKISLAGKMRRESLKAVWGGSEIGVAAALNAYVKRVDLYSGACQMVYVGFGKIRQCILKWDFHRRPLRV